MVDFAPTHVFVDGSSFLYRAYYSSVRSDFRNSKGEPVGAIMIFSKMLHALRNKYQNVPLVVVFDAHVPCFRKELYNEYKSNRKRMPDDLRLQEEVIYKIIISFGCDLVIVPGIEADDVLGSYSVLAKKFGARALICSGDKDLFQLVNDNVVIEDTMNDVVYDRETGTEKFGIPPELMVDFLALKGDASDNIPGMPKVGDVTAKLILNSIGSIEEIKKNLEKVKSLGFKGAKTFPDKFVQHLEIIELSYKLAKIKTDAQLPIPFDELKYKECDVSALSNIYKENGLHSLNASLMRENPCFMENSVQPEKEKKYKSVSTHQELELLVSSIYENKICSIHIDTTEQHYMDASIVGISVAVKEGCSFYIPIIHNYLGVQEQLDLSSVLKKLETVFSDDSVKKVCFDCKRIKHILFNQEVKLEQGIYDPLIEAYLLNSTVTKNDLDVLAQSYLDYAALKYDDFIGTGKNKRVITEIPVNEMVNYSAEKADLALRLHNVLYQKIHNDEKLDRFYNNQYIPMINVLFSMERNGVCVSIKDLNNLSSKFEQKLESVEQRIYELAGHDFKISSPKQVAHVLFEELKYLPSDPILKKQIAGGKFSTNEDILADLAQIYELPADILEYRGISKLKNTYTDVLPKLVSPKTNRIHTTFHLNGTITGRLSSSDPNMQNIPIRSEEGKLIRQTFIARPGYKIVAADYSQIELRILANMSNDEKLIAAFNCKQDIHTLTASEILGIKYEEVTQDQRRNAKAINFGIIYGMSSFGLAKQLKIDRKVAKNYIDNYFARYPSIKYFLDGIVNSAKENGYVTTINNRIIPIKDIKSSNQMVAKAAERVATNAPMQGSAADVIQLAMIKIASFIKNEAEEGSVYMVLQVHDELVFEIRADLAETYAEKIKNIMEHVFELPVKLDVGVGIADNWELAH